MKKDILVLYLVSTLIIRGYGMHLEAYWEADYVLPKTKDCWKPRPPITESPINIDLKKNIPKDFPAKDLTINIAFADFDVDRCERPHGLCREIVCGLKLYEDVDEVLFTNLVEAIKRVQESGSLVKLSFGGWAEYGNLRVPTKTTQMAETIASGIVDRVQRLGVDGVDFMQAKGCGIRNMRCDDQTSTHLFLLELIRKKMPKGKLLSYSFPVSRYGLDFPFVNIVKYGHRYLDSISLMGVHNNKTILSVLDLGIPASKVFWGFSKGCHPPVPYEADVEDVAKIASDAKSLGLGGLSMWSLNRGVFRNATICTTVDVFPDGRYFRAINPYFPRSDSI